MVQIATVYHVEVGLQNKNQWNNHNFITNIFEKICLRNDNMYHRDAIGQLHIAKVALIALEGIVSGGGFQKHESMDFKHYFIKNIFEKMT